MSENTHKPHTVVRSPEHQAHHAYHESRVADGARGEASGRFVSRKVFDETPEVMTQVSEAPKDTLSSGLATLQQQLSREIEAALPKMTTVDDTPKEQLLDLTTDVAVESEHEELSEESQAMLAIESEEPEAPEEVFAPTLPEIVPSPAVESVLENHPEVVENAPVEVNRVERETPLGYEPKVGDIAKLDGARVRLERELESEGTRIGFEVIQRNATTSLAYEKDLTFTDPTIEKIQTEAALRNVWVTHKTDLLQLFRPSHISSLWNELYNDTINLGVDTFTSPETADRIRNHNRIALVAGKGALMTASARGIENDRQFVIDSERKEGVAA
jgi:hypothetical protein